MKVGSKGLIVHTWRSQYGGLFLELRDWTTKISRPWETWSCD